MMIADRLESVRARISAAAERSERAPGSVTLVVASKGRTQAEVDAAAGAGLHSFGENRVADLAARAVARPELSWHCIGRLQTNKVRSLPPATALIHSVDRPSLVKELGRVRPEVPVLIQVNVAGEVQKGGVDPTELESLLGAARTAGLTVHGLMTVAALHADPEAARPAFRALARLARDSGLAVLSMGMTNDFEVAIEEGSTMVRIGRAIFE